MRIKASLRALVALASVPIAVALPQGDSATCAAETVFITVGAPAPSIAFGTTVMSMISTETVAVSTVTVYPESVSSGFSATPYSVPTAATSGTGPASESEAASGPGSIITTQTFTIPVGPAGSPFTGTVTLTEPCPDSGCGTTPSVPAGAPTAGPGLTTYFFTTTITSGYSPQVVETSTYTVIETAPTSSSSHSMVTASFTLTVGTVTATPTSRSIESTSTPVASAEPPPSSATTPPSVTLTAAPAPVSPTVFTVTLPGVPGSSAQVITITAATPVTGGPSTGTPVVITETTTLYSGTTEVPGPPPSPLVTSLVFTYTISEGSVPIATLTESTDFTYVASAGAVGTSFTTVSTVTTFSTATVLVSTGPSLSTSSVNSSFVPSVTTVTPEPPPSLPPSTSGLPSSAPFANSTTGASGIPGSFSTVSTNGTAAATSVIVSLNSTTVIAPFPTGNASSPSASETALPSSGIVTGSLTTVIINETAPATSAIIPANSTTLIAPLPTGNETSASISISAISSVGAITGVTTISISGSAAATSLIIIANSTTVFAPLPTGDTSLPPLPGSSTTPPPFPTDNGTTSVLPPSGTGASSPLPISESAPSNASESAPASTSTAVPLNSTTAASPVPTNVTASTATSIIVPLNSTTLALPLPTNGTASATSSVLVPLNTTTEILPLPTNGTSINGTSSTGPGPGSPLPTSETAPAPGNTTVPTPPLGNGTSASGAAPPPSTGNGTAPTAPPSAGTSEGGAAPTSVNGTVTASPSANVTSMSNGTAPTPSGPEATAPANTTVPSILPTGGPSSLANSSLPASPTANATSGPLPTSEPPLNTTTPLNSTAPTPTSNTTASGGPGQSAPPQSAPPQSAPPQGAPPQSAPPQGAPPSSGPPQSAPPQSAPPQGAPPQSAPPQSAPPQGAPPQGSPSQGAPSQGGPPQGAPSQGSPQGAPSQGPPQGAPSQGGPPQGAPSQGSPQGSPQGAPPQGGPSQGGPSQGGPLQGAPVQGAPLQSAPPHSVPPPFTTSEPARALSGPAQPDQALSTQINSVEGRSTLSSVIKARSEPTETAAPLCDDLVTQSNVVLDFDNLPGLHLAPGTDPEDIAPDPMYSPYRHFTWSEAFKIIPASAAPYKPSSGDLMLEVPIITKDDQQAKMGVGNLQANPCFRFDFAGLRVGCASKKAKCMFNITGLSWDDDSQTEMTVGSQMSSTRACARQMNCKLGSLVADATAGLSNLTSLLIDVTANDQPQKWWADDMAVTWTDTSCEAAICRSGVRDIYPKRGRSHGMTQIVKIGHP
ncbi:hypothetical protein N8I77_003739 [Diaporthe amygdali]|uniref:DUF7371 domain-containing protein n=1 Tax=Phomopsis amygdali TaxID=1214568 RepID=A0AAD9SJX5_PHOAM|nr:hypothetical protein N8I77_003739 [Diaporthe amygdali]